MIESVFWDAGVFTPIISRELGLDEDFISDNDFHLSRFNEITFERLSVALKKAAEREPRFLGDFGLYVNIEDSRRRSIDDASSITIFSRLDSDGVLTFEVGIREPCLVAESEAKEAVMPLLRSSNVELFEVEYEVYSADGDYMAFELGIPPSWTMGKALNLVDLIGLIVGPDQATPNSPAGAFALLISGHPEALMGQPESVFLEIKEKGYGFQNENQKHEYAMDLAALANTERGALLVIGMKTVRNGAGQDVVSGAPGCAVGSLSVDAYGQIARQRVVPPVEGLEIHLFEYMGRHMMALMIPAQPGYLKPFLVKGGVTVEGRTSGASFTIPTRIGDARWNMSAEAVHSLLVAARVALSKSE
ncbi:AlbA family DNA-binding domain-containing protein [Micromonospora chalcea]|uniref:AlbA family DNA-binding domain-containing protein n=1 Tax=Micromonospora chalcea TaxID=1874 RepID=UPI0033E43770